MSIYLSNAFSLQMQGVNEAVSQRITLEDAQDSLTIGGRVKTGADDEGEHTGAWTGTLRSDVVSIVGHADIANIISRLLSVAVSVNRVSVTLTPDDTLIVGQYVGPRLPEGCKTIPEGARIEWYRVTVQSPSARRVTEEAAETASHTRRDAIRAAFGLNPADANAFLSAENAAFCGYPDDDGRNGLAARHGLSRIQLDAIL